MSRFTAIPNAPDGVGSEWELNIITALSESVRLLSGEIRGSRALLKDMITVRAIPEENFFGVTATAKRNVLSPSDFVEPTFSSSLEGYISISTINSDMLNEDTLTELFGTQRLVPEDENLISLITLADYQSLVSDVLRLAQDVQTIRVTLAALISQIRG